MTMSDYDNTNRGALFKNNEKTEETHPDYRGRLNVDGVDLWLSAWLKTSKNGMKYMSLSVKPQNPDTVRQTNRPAKSAGSGSAPFDDAIPF
jgi:uncharacterized protein (DUF736 family)